jgi:hypothetical protein
MMEQDLVGHNDFFLPLSKVPLSSAHFITPHFKRKKNVSKTPQLKSTASAFSQTLAKK